MPSAVFANPLCLLPLNCSGRRGLARAHGGRAQDRKRPGGGSPYSGLPLTLVILTVAYVIHVLSSYPLEQIHLHNDLEGPIRIQKS